MRFIKIYGNIDAEKEKKSKKLKEKRKILSNLKSVLLKIIIFVSMYIFFSILLESDINISTYLRDAGISYSTEYFDICNALFGIQATISTLTIAFISIFSGMIKEKNYGQYIVKYILKIKNNKFSIFNLSVLLFLFTGIYFFYLLKTAYIICVIIFILSLIIIIYILITVLDLTTDYDKLKYEMEQYIKFVIKFIEKIKYKDDGEKNILYILEKNNNLKELYYHIEDVINELFNDTIEKMNVNDFNYYIKNIEIIEDILINFDCYSMNLIQEDLFDTFMQRTCYLIDSLLSRKQIDVAMNLIGHLSGKVHYSIQKENLNDDGKKYLINKFDIDVYILKLCKNIKEQFKYDSDYMINLQRLIDAKQYYYLLYLEQNLLTENYDRDKVIESMRKMFESYKTAIKSNVYWTTKEKENAMKFFEKYIKECENEDTKKSNFMNYDTYLILSKVNKRILKSDDKEYHSAMREEIKQIKAQLLDTLK